jgi:hypothetical protein
MHRDDVNTSTVYCFIYTRIILFSPLHVVQSGSGAHPASYPMDTWGSSTGVKRTEREANHSPQTSVEVKNYVDLYIHLPIRLCGVVFN